MSKLYIFGIGGTGSRVLKSLTMLLAAGVDCGVDTIVPIIIDRDKGNGDYTRTDGLIKSYIEINKIAPKRDEDNIKNRFFNTKIEMLGNDLLLRLNNETRRFADFIGISTQSNENRALSEMLFSEATLGMDTEQGFRGNPNIGSVVLNQFENQDIFTAFASNFQQGDKIFIVSSIFGGTGASGFPLLRKILQTPNLQNSSGTVLPNWGLINNAPIGAITVLPYFNVDRKSTVDPDTFNDKTRAALSYYETEDGKLDTLYYIGDTNRTRYPYAEGGEGQKNNAHFVELAAAMSILDFVNPNKSNQNFTKNNNGDRRTVYKEFGINSNSTEISFDNLAADTQALIVNPLSRFTLFAKYMGYSVVTEVQNEKEVLVVKKIAKYNIFDKESKHQPYAHNRFNVEFRKDMSHLDIIFRLFIEWLNEMEQQNRKFSPFNLTTADAFNFVKGDVSLYPNKKSLYRNWAKVDNELNKQTKSIANSLNNKGIFLELFYRSLEEMINQTSPNDGNGNNRYIFRLQSGNNIGLLNTIAHWGVSNMYAQSQRNAITCSNQNSEKQPTSIPSPFARIALVKTAFKEVASSGNEVLRAYQKIVSDSLDIAEIFFTYDSRWKNVIEIIKWDKNIDLQNLRPGHHQLYKTLQAFLSNDEKSYNFSGMNAIYLLKHIQSNKIIGATSPCTLFMSSENNLDSVNLQLSNTHRAFQGIIPLHQRSWDFQQYLYAWIAANDSIINTNDNGRAAISLFQEFAEYLTAQRPLINRNAEINNINQNALQIMQTSYRELRAPDVEILGRSTYQSRDINPTAKDFFESKIIQFNECINKNNYFDGNIQNNNSKSYILPIKNYCFKKYTINELKKYLKINYVGDVVEVIINDGLHIYQKKYKSSDGEIVTLYFDCAIYPNIKFPDESMSNYRMGIVCNFNEKEKVNAEFVKIGAPIPATCIRHSVRNKTFSENFQLKNYSLEGSNFDYVRIKYKNVEGIIIPALEPKFGNETYSFAIDFGTTNTHIEYKNGNSVIKPFDISKVNIDEKQVHLLHGGEDLIKEVFDEEYIPDYTDEEFNFPMRTALSYGEDTNWNNVYPFEKASLNELYEKRLGYPYNKTETDLKWSDKANSQKQVKAYIESLMFLLRNKVIIGNGYLKNTKITWFYPVSMERGRFNNLKSVWEDAYSKYFGGNLSNLLSITESIAPFEYYVRSGNTDNLVNIDIGGETTDIVISSSNAINCITSFRFAANSIFGDGYATNRQTKNGIVRQFMDEIRNELLTSIARTDNIFEIFDDMYNNRKSSDIASFLFSLKQNKKVKNAGANLATNANLNAKLKQDSSQKITFIIFYSAIIYHLAKLMKAKNLKMPDKIVFSGNGSRVIPFFSDDSDIRKNYTKLIFEKVYNQEYHSNDLSIVLNEQNPKEATCRGGFYVNSPDTFSDVLRKQVVLHSNGTDSIIRRDNGALKETDTYNSIDDNYITQTVKETEKFLNFVFDLLPFFAEEGYRLNNESINIAKDECYKRLDIYTKNGWNQKKDEITLSDSIEETLFFYPLVGMLNALSSAICDNNLKNT